MTGEIIKPGAFNGDGPKTQPDVLNERESLILEAAQYFTHALDLSKDIDDGCDHMMIFLQEVERLREADSDEWNCPAGGMANQQETKTDNIRSLEPEAIKRLQDLLGEIANMHLAIKHLSDHEDSEATCYAVSALQTGMGDRIERSVNLVYGSRE